MRAFDWRGKSHAIFLDSERPFAEGVRGSPRFRAAQRGHWGVAVLSRLPVRDSEVVELGRLARDRARRAALMVTVTAGPEVHGDVDPRTAVRVIGTHMSHITYGAPGHYLRLGRALRSRLGSSPAVLAGDMNLWGPPLSLLLPGWRRTARGKTWPAWRPHSQVDHVLVSGALRVLGGEVVDAAGSDHLPVRVTLALETAH